METPARDAIPDVIESEPVHPFEMDKEMFLQNLRTVRRGAAGGPSGMRDNGADSTRFFDVSQAFAQAKIPDEIVSALRVGQLTALEKPNGGLRGVIVGDVIRWLAKTMSQQFMARFEDATKPFQHALSTRAGCESIAWCRL